MSSPISPLCSRENTSSNAELIFFTWLCSVSNKKPSCKGWKETICGYFVGCSLPSNVRYRRVPMPSRTVICCWIWAFAPPASRLKVHSTSPFCLYICTPSTSSKTRNFSLCQITSIIAELNLNVFSRF